MKIISSLILFMFLFVLPAMAQLAYKGEQTLWEDTVWEGEVLVDGILTVAPGVTLEVRPGTVVRFTRMDSNKDEIGEHELFVQGTFLALGTATKPIIFTSAETRPIPGDWGAVNMMASTAENRFEHCLFEYGYRGFHAHFASARLEDCRFRYNRRGAQFQESTVSIKRCRFINNYNGVQFRDSTVSIKDSHIVGGYWGLRCVYSTLDMSDSIVENNLVNGVNFRDSEIVFTANIVRNNRRGVYLQRSKAAVTRNVVTNNREYGLFLEDASGAVGNNDIAGNGRAGLRIINSVVKIADNNVLNNGGYGLINDGDQDVQVGANWWGTTDTAGLSRLFRDGSDRQGVGLVRTDGHLNGPVEN